MKEFMLKVENVIENQSMTAYFYSLMVLFISVSVLTGNLSRGMLIVQIFMAFCFAMIRGIDKLLQKQENNNDLDK